MIQNLILIHNLWITAVDNDVKNSLLVDKKENFRVIHNHLWKSENYPQQIYTTCENLKIRVSLRFRRVHRRGSEYDYESKNTTFMSNLYISKILGEK